ncbi:hypothetical protein BGX38DRAFT_1279600 [Terfezia claveryi]|nr:hypothetical protein BGX38DRAFT_1279600 [Terfezia claveryi]
MSAQMVEILGEEDDAVKRGRMNVRTNHLTLEDRTFLAAMAEKRGRMEQDANDDLAREAPRPKNRNLGRKIFLGHPLSIRSRIARRCKTHQLTRHNNLNHEDLTRHNNLNHEDLTRHNNLNHEDLTRHNNLNHEDLTHHNKLNHQDAP